MRKVYEIVEIEGGLRPPYMIVEEEGIDYPVIRPLREVERCEHYRLEGHWGPAEAVMQDGNNVGTKKTWCKGAGLEDD